jgi:hypothetical protein
MTAARSSLSFFTQEATGGKEATTRGDPGWSFQGFSILPQPGRPTTESRAARSVRARTRPVRLNHRFMADPKKRYFVIPLL